jgi:hypothetical protein
MTITHQHLHIANSVHNILHACLGCRPANLRAIAVVGETLNERGLFSTVEGRLLAVVLFMKLQRVYCFALWRVVR